ncbi:MAG: hypothetical protein CML04_05960 [Pseudozobellia sp.]|nr:hypothetical protein [Pseudozobellia sp.]MBG47944.1 hypothetical protein [Pseudozobellia sp.]
MKASEKGFSKTGLRSIYLDQVSRKQNWVNDLITRKYSNQKLNEMKKRISSPYCLLASSKQPNFLLPESL